MVELSALAKRWPRRPEADQPIGKEVEKLRVWLERGSQEGSEGEGV